jgi:rhomboid protease GluP
MPSNGFARRLLAVAAPSLTSVSDGSAATSATQVRSSPACPPPLPGRRVRRVQTDPRDPLDPAEAAGPFDPGDPGSVAVEDAGFLPPDPAEPPPVELWSAVGDVPPWGTALLLLAWAAVFALIAARHEIDDTAAYLLWGASATGLAPLDTAWRLLASTFVHAGAAHVFFNATSMLIFGPAVERIFTRWAFWIVYALGGAAASLGSLLWRTSQHGAGLNLSVGASGAIFALGGALLAGAFRLRHRLAPGRARALGAAMLFLLGQGMASGFTRLGTDNVAHAVGLVAGGAIGAVVPLSGRLGGPPPALAIRTFGALCALALALSLALALRGGLRLG